MYLRVWVASLGLPCCLEQTKTNSLNVALFSTVVTILVLVETIVCHVCVSTTAVAICGGRRFRSCCFVALSQLVNMRDWVELTLKFSSIADDSFHCYSNLHSFGVLQAGF